jgi:Arc/MetJ family transcription regulator
MPSNLALDDGLLEEALQVGGLKTKRETVNLALSEFIQRRRAQDLIDMFGQVDFDPAYDYKALRRGRA